MADIKAEYLACPIRQIVSRFGDKWYMLVLYMLPTSETQEELYFILKGEGQYQVDGEIFPVSEGTIIRVAPDGKRALKNTGSENLTMLCIQYKANAFTEADSPMTDGVILQEELKW